MDKMLKLVKDSAVVIVGIVIAGLLLDEIGTKGRLGKPLQDFALKISRGFGP